MTEIEKDQKELHRAMRGNPDEPIESKAARYRAETLHLVAGMMDVMDRAKADGINITYSVNFNPAIGKHMIVALSLTKEL